MSDSPSRSDDDADTQPGDGSGSVAASAATPPQAGADGDESASTKTGSDESDGASRARPVIEFPGANAGEAAETETGEAASEGPARRRPTSSRRQPTIEPPRSATKIPALAPDPEPDPALPSPAAEPIAPMAARPSSPTAPAPAGPPPRKASFLVGFAVTVVLLGAAVGGAFALERGTVAEARTLVAAAEAALQRGELDEARGLFVDADGLLAGRTGGVIGIIGPSAASIPKRWRTVARRPAEEVVVLRERIVVGLSECRTARSATDDPTAPCLSWLELARPLVETGRFADAGALAGLAIDRCGNAEGCGREGGPHRSLATLLAARWRGADRAAAAAAALAGGDLDGARAATNDALGAARAEAKARADVTAAELAAWGGFADPVAAAEQLGRRIADEAVLVEAARAIDALEAQVAAGASIGEDAFRDAVDALSVELAGGHDDAAATRERGSRLEARRTRLAEIARAFEGMRLLSREVEDEGAIRMVFLDATEVDNAAFRRFVAERKGYTTREHWDDDAVFATIGESFTEEATGKVGPALWRDGRPEVGAERQPVRGVSWFEARAFARSIGKRLPAEVEWELAVRGAERERAWPWGEQPVDNTRSVLRADGRDDPADVKSCASGASPEGIHDLIGNVWEIVERVAADPVARGASFKVPPQLVRDTRGVFTLTTFQGDVLRPDDVGFRCARDLVWKPAGE